MLHRVVVVLVCAGLMKLTHLVYAQDTSADPLGGTEVPGAFGPSGQPPELAPTLSERFNELDRNRDGFISADEAALDERLSAAFAELDQSQDRRLDLAEFSVFVIEPAIDTLDRNPGAAAPQ